MIESSGRCLPVLVIPGAVVGGSYTNCPGANLLTCVWVWVVQLYMVREPSNHGFHTTNCPPSMSTNKIGPEHILPSQPTAPHKYFPSFLRLAKVLIASNTHGECNAWQIQWSRRLPRLKKVAASTKETQGAATQLSRIGVKQNAGRVRCSAGKHFFPARHTSLISFIWFSRSLVSFSIHIVMTRMRTASQSAKKKRNRRVKGAIRAAAAQPPTSHSPAGESDNMPPSGSKRPRPKKPASTKKKARGKQIFLESDDPLEKVS